MPELENCPPPAATALAFIHRTDHRLLCSNSAFRALWRLDEAWLKTRPGWSEILDRLRIEDKLPETRDFKVWKAAQLERIETRETSPELWHFARGMSLRVSLQPLKAAVTLLLFEDVSERLRWERACRAMLRVQKSMLALQEGPAAVFGPDGRLKSCNDRFAHLCRLGAEEHELQPHVRVLAARPGAKIAETLWSEILAAITANDPTQLIRPSTHTKPASQQRRYARLPDGTTLVQFLTPQQADGYAPLSHEDRTWQAVAGSFD